MMHYSIIIPTLNEAENIWPLVSLIKGTLGNLYSYEIIFVDDDSPDHTWEVCEKLSHTDSKIKVIRRIGQKGLNSAVVAGLAKATGAAIVVMDADMQHDISILPSIFDSIKENDIVIGSRLTDNGNYGNFKTMRKWISKIGSFLVYAKLGTKVKDPLSGYFAIHRNLLESMASKIEPSGFKILLEILIHNSHVRIKEIGYTFQERKFGHSKLNSTVFLEALKTLFFKNQYP